MPIDDRTINRSYQLPNAANQLIEDVARLRAALTSIDADIFARYTKTEVDQLITNLISGAPGALDTLNELAAAMGDDPNFAATVTNQLALKADSSNVYSKAEADARYVQGSTQTEMVFIATANQSVFTLSTAVINKPSALVTVDGVVQPTSEYSLNMAGTELTLSEGVPVGTIVRVLALGVASAGAPADDTITTIKLRDLAVTAAKLADSAVVAAKLATDAVTEAKIQAEAVTSSKIANAAVTLLKLSAGAGAADQVLSTDGTQLAWVTRRRFQETGSIALAGTLPGLGIIPSWASRITIVILAMSTNGSAPPKIVLGNASGYVQDGYEGRNATLAASAALSDGFLLGVNTTVWSSSVLAAGRVTLDLIQSTTNNYHWVATGQLAAYDQAQLYSLAGRRSAADIDRLAFYINGIQQFDAGYVNVIYEG